MKLSIVLPIYNVERYIKRCLDSIYNQGVDNDFFEVIAIDDETPDRSIEIVKDYSKKYSNINIIRQKNKGLSGARNSGLNVAKGSYIWFVDSDDCISPNSLSYILDKIQSSFFEILAFDFIALDGKNEYRDSLLFRPDKNGIMSGSCFLKLNYGKNQAWRHIYNVDFLRRNNLWFTEGLLHEDIEFNIRAYTFSQTLIYLEKPCYYYYTTREGSIMNTVSFQLVHSYWRYIYLFDDFIYKNKLSKGEVKIISQMVCHALTSSIMEARKMTSNDKIYFLREVTSSRSLFIKFYFRSAKLFFYLKGLLLYLNPQIAIKLFYFIHDMRYYKKTKM